MSKIQIRGIIEANPELMKYRAIRTRSCYRKSTALKVRSLAILLSMCWNEGKFNLWHIVLQGSSENRFLAPRAAPESVFLELVSENTSQFLISTPQKISNEDSLMFSFFTTTSMIQLSCVSWVGLMNDDHMYMIAFLISVLKTRCWFIQPYPSNVILCLLLAIC